MTEKSFAETLRTSEAVRFLTDAFPVYISFIDTEHRYQFVNKAYLDRHDRSREEIEGRHVRDFSGDKGYEQVRPHLERTEAGERSTFEVHVRDMYHVATLVPHYGPDGQVDGSLVLSLDVTELVAARAALDSERARRTLEAELLHHAVELGAESDSFHEALQRIVEKVCQMTDWPVGHVYVVCLNESALKRRSNAPMKRHAKRIRNSRRF